MKYKIDVVRIRENSITLNGWAIGRSPESRATFRVEDGKHQPVKFKHVSTRRDDVSQIYYKAVHDREFGFDIQFPYERGKSYYLLIRCEGKQARIKFTEELVAKRASVAHKRLEKIKDLMNMETVHVAMDFWKEHGLKALVLKSKHKLQGIDNDYDYSEWYDLIRPTDEELAAQRQKIFDFEPLLSVVIPAYKTPERYLREMLDSIVDQTYTNWEICIADGSPRGQGLERVLKRYADEDKLDMDGKALFDPHFKPDFNPDLLTSVNYICHLFVVRKDLLERVGGFRQEFDGAQDYDFIFRCTEAAREVYHIPKVLYHWRCHQDSTASNPESKMYAFEAGSRAIMAHYERMGIQAERVEKGVDYGIYHTVFKLQAQPLVSVIIPNKDHTADLDVCVQSLMGKSSYRNLEFIVVENNSREKETFEYYGKMQAMHSNFHVVTWEKGFNYSAINNFGAGFAKGEYLLLLNNDTELINPDSIQEMLGFCQREDVGIAGARLLYEDDTIQHAGVVIGFGGIAGHTFIGLHKAENSYFHRAMCAQDYSAVTAACLMTKKSVFDAVGGLSEELAVAFNDIDYCMKVRALGKLVVYAPYACFYHYESKSRGLEDTPEKVERFNREVAVFIKKWPDIIRKGDPYYNPNLTLRKSNFALRDLQKEKIGEPYDLKIYEQFAPEDK